MDTLNLTALMTGIIIAVYVVVHFRKTVLERKAWVYPLLIASFPVYYWVFAIYGSDLQALYKEIVVGIFYFGLIFVALKVKRNLTLLLLAIASISHALYDMFHDSVFTNSGVPLWWPELCGSIDIIIGLYLLYLANSLSTPSRTNNLNSDPENERMN